MSPTADARSRLQEQADAAAAAGDFTGARRLLERAVLESDASAELWMKLTAMRRASGDAAGALAAVERALALAPLDFSALLSRAMLLERLGDARAGEAFERAL